jgi:hypothetical protein
MAALGEVGSAIVSAYSGFVASLPFWAQNFINLFLLSIVVVLYSVAIWKFYRFIAHKNILALNLSKYNRSEHPMIAKTIAALFYFLEYIVILPFVVFLWFAMFTVFLILLTEGIELNTSLIVSATIVAAARMTAYYKEDLARDIAKLLPFTLLGAAITNVNAFSFKKIITQLFALPSFFSHVASYMLFIFVIEMILRLVETTFVATGVHDEESGLVSEAPEAPKIE